MTVWSTAQCLNILSHWTYYHIHFTFSGSNKLRKSAQISISPAKNSSYIWKISRQFPWDLWQIKSTAITGFMRESLLCGTCLIITLVCPGFSLQSQSNGTCLTISLMCPGLIWGFCPTGHVWDYPKCSGFNMGSLSNGTCVRISSMFAWSTLESPSLSAPAHLKEEIYLLKYAAGLLQIIP